MRGDFFCILNSDSESFTSFVIDKGVVADFENPGVELLKIWKRIAGKISLDVGLLRNIIRERGITAA